MSAKYYNDPLGWVLAAFPWGKPGTFLSEFDGPDTPQIEVLEAIRHSLERGDSPIQIARASGHGVGKTATMAMILLWFANTRPDCNIKVTANTQEQLHGVTWRELAKWHNVCIARALFTWTATGYRHKYRPATWGARAIPWSESNTQAFAGTHEKHVLMLFDEGSTIIDGVWEVATGAMTTPGAMWVVMGNPTKNSGYFRTLVRRSGWQFGTISSETSRFTDKAYLKQMELEEGRDSDYYKVRVLGQFPSVGAAQLIPLRAIEAAQDRHIEDYELEGIPLIMGCDIGRGGDPSVYRFRRGPKLYRYRIESREDNLMRTASRIAALLTDGVELEDGYKHRIRWAMVDETGLGGGVVDRLHQLGHVNAIGVMTGEASPDPARHNNLRTYLWFRLRDWVESADIPKHDTKLSDDMMMTEWGPDDRNRSKLEAKKLQKKRLGRSPDDADAVALTMVAVAEIGDESDEGIQTELEYV